MKAVTARAERGPSSGGAADGPGAAGVVGGHAPIVAAEMCLESVSPAWHSLETTLSLVDLGMTGGPCPTWPRWAHKVEAAKQALLGLPKLPAAPPDPPPGPPSFRLADRRS